MCTHFNLSLRAQRGNLDAVAMMVRRRVLNLNEIATWFDRLTMSGCALRNDGASFDRLRMSGGSPSPIKGEGEERVFTSMDRIDRIFG